MNESIKGGGKATVAALGMLVAAICLSLVALWGCSAQTLAGTWEGQAVYKDSAGLTYDVPATLTITKDGKYTMNVEKNGRWTGITWSTSSYAGTCEVQGNVVKLYYDDNGNYFRFDYVIDTTGKETLRSYGSSTLSFELERNQRS